MGGGVRDCGTGGHSLDGLPTVLGVSLPPSRTPGPFLCPLPPPAAVEGVGVFSLPVRSSRHLRGGTGRDAGGRILKRGAMSLPHSWHTSGGIGWQDLWVLETQNCLYWDGRAQPNSEPEACQADPIAGTNAARRIVLFCPVEARSPHASWRPGVDAAPTARHEVLLALRRAGEGWDPQHPRRCERHVRRSLGLVALWPCGPLPGETGRGWETRDTISATWK